jgi:hypothetical protein
LLNHGLSETFRADYSDPSSKNINIPSAAFSRKMTQKEQKIGSISGQKQPGFNQKLMVFERFFANFQPEKGHFRA